MVSQVQTNSWEKLVTWSPCQSRAPAMVFASCLTQEDEETGQGVLGSHSNSTLK